MWYKALYLLFLTNQQKCQKLRVFWPHSKSPRTVCSRPPTNLHWLCWEKKTIENNLNIGVDCVFISLSEHHQLIFNLLKQENKIFFLKVTRLSVCIFLNHRSGSSNGSKIGTLFDFAKKNQLNFYNFKF